MRLLHRNCVLIFDFCGAQRSSERIEGTSTGLRDVSARPRILCSRAKVYESGRSSQEDDVASSQPRGPDGSRHSSAGNVCGCYSLRSEFDSGRGHVQRSDALLRWGTVRICEWTASDLGWKHYGGATWASAAWPRVSRETVASRDILAAGYGCPSEKPLSTASQREPEHQRHRSSRHGFGSTPIS